MSSRDVFVMKDMDTDIKVAVGDTDDVTFVTIMNPSHDAFITMTLADFKRMAASVARATDE